MHEISQCGHFDTPMRVIRQDRHTRWRTRGAHHPVVATLRGDRPGGDLCGPYPGSRHQGPIGLDDLQRRQPARDERVSVTGTHGLEDVLGDDADVEALRDPQIIPRVRRSTPIRLLNAVARHVERKLHLVDRMPPDARDRERRPPQDDGPRGPRVGLDTGQLELHWEVVAIRLDIRVHPAGVGTEKALGVRVIAGPFLGVERPAEHHQPGAAVVVEGLGTEDLGEPPLVPAPPHLHLPQPVLCHDVPLGEEEVVVVLGIDVRDPPCVPDDFHGLPQTRDLELSLDLRQ